jgi:NAD(P)-dependent dehydrogenase (short-subunit alcohol dehydrogenase family)
MKCRVTQEARTRLAGKVVLIGGGATGIGAAVARRAAAQGAGVVVADVHRERAEATAEAVGGEAVWFDIADEDSVRSTVAHVAGRYGRLDGLHCNAADISPATYGRDTDVVDVDLDVWHRTLAITLHGYFFLARHAIPLMLAGGGGSIVTTSSDAAFMGDAAHVSYAVAKSGVTALTRHVAQRWGKQGLRCNAVAPGLTMSEVAVEHGNREWHERYLAAAPTPRLGTPEDIAAMVVFLLSDEAGYVNGQTISVNGGYVLR